MHALVAKIGYHQKTIGSVQNTEVQLIPQSIMTFIVVPPIIIGIFQEINQLFEQPFIPQNSEHRIHIAVNVVDDLSLQRFLERKLGGTADEGRYVDRVRRK